MPTVFQQERVVEAGGVSFAGFDLDVSVRKPKEDPLEFEVLVWNLSEASWRQIDTGDPMRIRLGWRDGATETVCVGTIDELRRGRDGDDLQFTLAGVDETAAALQQRPERGETWRNASPDRIAADIATTVGLSPVTDSAPPISGSWSLSTDRQWGHWLDALVSIAEEKTGDEWETIAERGQLHFVRTESQVVTAPKLSYDGLLLSVSEKDDQEDDTEGQLEFEAMLEPRIRKGAVVTVAPEAYSGAYRVADYEFASATVNGDHEVRGTLTPLDADYSIVRPPDPATGGL